MFTFPSSMFSSFNVATPTFYSADLGFIVAMYVNTTNITGIYVVVNQAVWQTDQIYEAPIPSSSSNTYTTPFSVTPDLADVDIGGDLYVDTGDRYFDHTLIQVLDTTQPYWTLQVQFSIRARWTFSSTDHFDYDLPRCADANIKIRPAFGTLTNQRTAFTGLMSTESSTLLPSTNYTIAVQGDTLIDTRTITVNYPNIGVDSVDFNGNLRVLYLTEELDLTGTNIDTTSYSPEIITAPLYWYWESPSTFTNYDL